MNLTHREERMKKIFTRHIGLALLVLCSAYTPQAAAVYVNLHNRTKEVIKFKLDYKGIVFCMEYPEFELLPGAKVVNYDTGACFLFNIVTTVMTGPYKGKWDRFRTPTGKESVIGHPSHTLNLTMDWKGNISRE